MNARPRIFIGCSTRALVVADAIQANLSHIALAVKWTEGVFGLSSGNLENLLMEAKKSDFAVLIFTPDDLLTKKEQSSAAPRDNVVFELGLFMGSLGRDRCFIVYDESSKMDLPTDLAGVSKASFFPPADVKDYLAALGPACTEIKLAMQRASTAEFTVEDLLTGTWKLSVHRIAPVRDDVPDKEIPINFRIENNQLVGSFQEVYIDRPGYKRIVQCEVLPGNYLVLRSTPAHPGYTALGLMILKGDNICSEYSGRLVGIASKYGDVIVEDVRLHSREPQVI